MPTATLKKPRKTCVDVFNEFMLADVDLAGYYGIPAIRGTTLVPQNLVAFSDAVIDRVESKANTWVHFYEDDVKIERFWRQPNKYIEMLRSFAGVISPDYSLYSDFTPARKIWNTNRNYTCGAWLQTLGLNVIANVRTSGWDSVPYALAGAPKHSTIAIGSHGCLKRRDNRRFFIDDLHMTVDLLQPTSIVVYGSDAYGVFDYPRSLEIPVKIFPSAFSTRFRRKI